jgi:thymidylate kinase
MDFNDLIGGLNKEFNYCVWKGFWNVDDFLKGEDDLDLLFLEEDIEQVRVFFSSRGWILGRDPHFKFPYIDHYYYLFNGEIYHVHAYFRMITGESFLKEFDLGHSKKFLKSVSYDLVYRYPVPCYQTFFDLADFRAHVKSAGIISRFLYKQEHGDVYLALEYFNITNFIKGEVREIIVPSFFNALKYRIKNLEHLRYSLFELAFKRLTMYIYLVYRKITGDNKKRIENGFILGITGTDGSGKSSIVSALNNAYKTAFYVKTYSLGKPQGYISEKIRQLLNAIAGHRDITHSSHDKSNLTIFTFAKFLNSLGLAVLRWVASIHAYYYKRNGALIISDRWPTTIKGVMDGPKLYSQKTPFIQFCSKIEFYVYSKIKPSDLCIHIKVPLDVAISRNRDRTKDNKETDDEIKERYNQNIVVKPITDSLIEYDNTGSLSDAVNQVALIISKDITR